MSIQRLLRHIRNSFLNLGRTLSQSLSHFLKRGLGGLFRVGRGQQAGFVLPTVTMVMLVVSLLTLAMLLRSTDRGKNAQNFRVNEATLNATAPALDRAKAKIDKLFSDPTLSGRGTPSDSALLEIFNTPGDYTFGDEIPLVLVSDPDKDKKFGVEDTEDQDFKEKKISTQRPESLNAAWKFPVDTNNNGKFDSFTLYAIYLANSTGDEERPRYPLEARTSPMSEGQKPSRCRTSVVTAASKVGTSGWLKIDNKLKKSINVYAANVPITSLSDSKGTKVLDDKLYEPFQGAGGFSAIEYQQDRSRIPLSNNAVVYEDDLDISPGAGLELNGRVFTNGSLLIADTGEDIRLWLVSSPDSCFYEEEISKVLVGGNVANGRPNQNSDQKNALVDLFRGKGTAPATKKNLGKNEKTTTAGGGQAVASNTFAYQERIDYMVNAAVKLCDQTDNGKTGEEFEIDSSCDPQGIQNAITSKLKANADLDPQEVRKQELEVYFRQRTRRVPYAEVPAGESALFLNTTDLTPIDTQAKAEAFFKMERTGEADTTGLNPLRPPNRWMYPVDPTDNLVTYMKPKSGTGLVLDVDNPKASDPTLRNGQEHLVGDRVLVGNNLPEYVYNQQTQEFTKNGEQDLQKKDNKWFTIDGSKTTDNIRSRTSQVTTLTELGATDRDGFWELKAAEAPEDPIIDTVGGLRVVTGVGLYLPKAGTLPTSTAPTSTTTEPEEWPLAYTAWPDWMPMPKGHDNIYDELGKQIGGASGGDSDHPYLQMRATAVYHHDNDPSGDKGDPYNPNDTAVPDRYQTPIACVSSYYDPTDPDSANAGGSYTSNTFGSVTNKTNNGQVYAWPGDKWSQYGLYLEYQAKLRFPNGNWVNPILHRLDGGKMPNTTAWTTGGVKSGETLTLSEKTAIDTAFCAVYISGIVDTPNTSSIFPDGTIYETAFLDAREVKAIEDDETLGTKSSTTGKQYEPSNYDLPIERRQALEIRATVLDLGKMADTKFGSATPTQEYLLPNSGIIYATREDAVPDNSVQGNQALSSKDSVLDPYRRPHAIMLVNGADLSRETDYRLEERGLILATNVPVYIKGDFNKHTKGEFTTGTHLDYTRTQDKLDPNFACRKDQFSTCTEGESWRPTTIIADAIMLLSDNFQEGFRSDGDYDLRLNFDPPAKWWKNPSDSDYQFAVVKPSSDDIAPVLSKGFDANFDGDIEDKDTASEASPMNLKATPPQYGMDLNLDGDSDDTSVKETDIKTYPWLVARAIRRLNGFFDNNFVTSRSFKDSDYSREYTLSGTDNYNENLNDQKQDRKNKDGKNPYWQFQSSYFNNMVTPIQRRVSFPEYVMEVCPKLPVSACGPDDWYITGIDLNGDGNTNGENIDEGNVSIDRNGNNNTTDTISETAAIDLNGDGDTDDTVNEASVTIDLNGDGDTDDTVNEASLKFDLDGDGNTTGIGESSVAFNLDADDSTARTDIKEIDAMLHSYEFLADGMDANRLLLTTARDGLSSSNSKYKNFPRRVAFLRNRDNTLVLDKGTKTPIAFGVKSGKVKYIPYQNVSLVSINLQNSHNQYRGDNKTLAILNAIGKLPSSTTSLSVSRDLPTEASNALWFRTTTNDSDPTKNPYYGKANRLSYLEGLTDDNSDGKGDIPGEQPLLVPLLQLQVTTNTPTNIDKFTDKSVGGDNNENALERNWMQHATTSAEFNLVMTAGDIPARPQDENGGLGNYPRFLESWRNQNDKDDNPTKMLGSFIQLSRSAYADAPFLSLIPESTYGGIYDEEEGEFGYTQNYQTANGGGKAPYYAPPSRNWGFDVALLTQQPDLFSQQFTMPPTVDPNEFFRQVNRDDDWVKTLLCAAQPKDKKNGDEGFDAATAAYGTDYKYAIPEDQMPDTCPYSP